MKRGRVSVWLFWQLHNSSATSSEAECIKAHPANLRTAQGDVIHQTVAARQRHRPKCVFAATGAHTPRRNEILRIVLPKYVQRSSPLREPSRSIQGQTAEQKPYCNKPKHIHCPEKARFMPLQKQPS